MSFGHHFLFHSESGYVPKLVNNRLKVGEEPGLLSGKQELWPWPRKAWALVPTRSLSECPWGAAEPLR